MVLTRHVSLVRITAERLRICGDATIVRLQEQRRNYLISEELKTKNVSNSKITKEI